MRIIGGQWRSRRLPVAAQPGLRPTPDRVRETLFNWLAQPVIGARCLDLFAGSGALGFEALSRGAGTTIMVEQNPTLAQRLRANKAALAAERAEIVCADALAWLSGRHEPFDIVFLDPPFHSDYAAQCCALLLDNAALAPGAYVYTETGHGAPLAPPALTQIKRQRAGQIEYRLYRNQAGSS